MKRLSLLMLATAVLLAFPQRATADGHPTLTFQITWNDVDKTYTCLVPAFPGAAATVSVPVLVQNPKVEVSEPEPNHFIVKCSGTAPKGLQGIKDNGAFTLNGNTPAGANSRCKSTYGSTRNFDVVITPNGTISLVCHVVIPPSA